MGCRAGRQVGYRSNCDGAGRRVNVRGVVRWGPVWLIEVSAHRGRVSTRIEGTCIQTSTGQTLGQDVRQVWSCAAYRNHDQRSVIFQTSPQVGSPDASLLAPSAIGRCAACRAVRHRLQPALVAAGHGPSGPEGSFLRPVLFALIAVLDSDHPRSNSINHNQNFQLAGELDEFCRADYKQWKKSVKLA